MVSILSILAAVAALFFREEVKKIKSYSLPLQCVGGGV